MPHCVGQGLAPDEDCHWYLRVLEFCDVCGCVCTHAARRANCPPFSCFEHKVVPQRSNFLTLMPACPGINWTVPVIDHPRSQQQNRQATVISSGCLVRPSHTHDNTYLSLRACPCRSSFVDAFVIFPADRRLFYCFFHEWLHVSEVAMCFCKRAGASVAVLRLVHCIDVLRQLRGLRSFRLEFCLPQFGIRI